MELFEVIPSNLFTLLTSKNRELYAKGLLIVRKAFLNEVMLERTNLETSLTNQLQNDLQDLDLNEDEGFKLEDLKDNQSRAKMLVKRFLETGWIENEFARGNRMKEYLTLPRYSIKLLDLIYKLINEDLKEYDSFMYSMYSALNNADNEYIDYRYTAISSVYDKIQEFEITLRGLFTDLKRHYTRLSQLKTVNQMLYEHFDSYQTEIIKQIYLPLKTKDSISRFKGPILDIISKWFRDQEIMDQIIAQAIIYKQFKTKDEAFEDVINKINFITDKLSSLQSLLESIDQRNNEYVQSATDKMRFLLRNDKSISSKISQIIDKIAIDRANGDESSIDLISDSIELSDQAVLNEASLFNRSTVEKNYDNQQFIDNTDNSILNSDYDQFIDSIHNQYSDEGIRNYMKETMDELDKINSKDIPLTNMNDLVMFIYAFIKGFDHNSFYKIELNEGNLINNKYSVPDADFIRKGKGN